VRLSKKLAALTITAVTAVGIAGGAFAYWTQDGSGVGSASTGTTTAVTVNQDAFDSADDLYPGGDAVTLSGDFDNPNSGPVKVGSVTATVDAFISQADLLKPACTEADFVIGGSAPVNAEIDSGNSVGSWSGLTIQLANSSTNQDNCKGLSSVAISYSVSPAA
jgi:hypothetical protein